MKRNILSVKKYKTSAREKKKVGVKKTEKSLREKAFPPVKNPKKRQNWFSRALFIFTGKKIHTRYFKIANDPQKLHVKFGEILV